MIQVLFAGRGGTIPGGAQYAAIHGPSVWGGTESTVRGPWSAPGVFRNLVVDVSVAPGAGAARILTIRKNGAATALTVTISDSATTARLTGVDVAVAAGDLLVMQHTLTGAPVAAFARWSLEFEGSVPNQSGYGGVIGTFSTSTRACGIFAVSGQSSTVAADVRQTVAVAGTLTRTDLSASSAPGAGTGYTAYLNLNGVRQDGTGGTVDTACALIAVLQASRTYSLPLAAGDVVYLEFIPTGTISTRVFQVGTALTATTDGQSQLCGSTLGNVLSNSVAHYCQPSTIGAGVSPTETDFAVQLLPGVTSVRLSGFRVACSVAPGAGRSRVVDLRLAGASPGPSVTISDSATTASDLTGTMTVADGADRWNLRTVPTGTPATTVLHWSLIQGPAAPAERVQMHIWGPI